MTTDNFDSAESTSAPAATLTISRTQAQIALGALGVIVIAALAWILWPSSPTNAALIRDAVADIKAGNYSSAQSKLEQELQQNKANHNNLNAIVYFDLGVIAGKTGNHPQAIAYYNQSIALAPKYEPPLYNLAVETMNQGNAAAAIVQFNNVLAVSPKNSRALYNSGLLEYRSGNISDGQLRMNQAIALNPALAAIVPKDVSLG